MRILEREDVVQLLRIEVEKAGGQTAWAKKHKIDRTVISRILNGARGPTKKIIRTLGLRIVFVAE
jgi:DNA-binding phage protein